MPKDWELAYVNNNTPWNKGEASPGIKEWLKRNKLFGKGLVLGCGYGHDVRLLAEHNNGVVGIDISMTAIKAAKSFKRVSDEIYHNCDFFSKLPFEDHKFDWVLEHTFFCAIEESMRDIYVINLTKILKPKGRFLAIFFLENSINSKVEEGPPYKIKRENILRYFNPYFEVLDSYFPVKSYNCRPYGSEIIFYMQLKSPR